MKWRRMPGGKSGHTLFSTHPARLCAAAVLILLSGAIGTVLGLVVWPLLPAASPLGFGFGAVLTVFAATFALVHLFHWVEPMVLARTVFLMCFVMIAGLLGGLALSGAPLLPGGNPGGFTIELMALVGATVPTLLVLLAIGDRPPPVDETRLGHPPRL